MIITDPILARYWTHLDGRPNNHPSRSQDLGLDLRTLDREQANALLNFYRDLVFSNYGAKDQKDDTFRKFNLRDYEFYNGPKPPKKGKTIDRNHLLKPDEMASDEAVINLIGRYRHVDYMKALGKVSFSWEYYQNPMDGGNPYVVNHTTKEAIRTGAATVSELVLNNRGVYEFPKPIEDKMKELLGNDKDPNFLENLRLRMNLEEQRAKAMKAEADLKAAQHKAMTMQLELNETKLSLENATSSLNAFQNAQKFRINRRRSSSRNLLNSQQQGSGGHGHDPQTNSPSSTGYFSGGRNLYTETPPRGGAGSNAPAMRTNGSTQGHHQRAIRPPTAEYLNKFCNYCKMYGHETRSCTHFRRRPRGCWNCGLPDHRQFECKNDKVEGAGWLPGTSPEDRVRVTGTGRRYNNSNRRGIYRKSGKNDSLDRFPERISSEGCSDSTKLLLNEVVSLEGLESLDKKVIDNIIKAATTAASWNEDDLRRAISKAKLDLERELLREYEEREVMKRTLVIKNVDPTDKEKFVDMVKAKQIAAQTVKEATENQIDINGFIKELKWKEITLTRGELKTTKCYILIELFSRELQLRATAVIEELNNRNPEGSAKRLEQGLTKKQIDNDKWVVTRAEEQNKDLEPGHPDEFIIEGEKGNTICRRRVRYNKSRNNAYDREGENDGEVEVLLETNNQQKQAEEKKRKASELSQTDQPQEKTNRPEEDNAQHSGMDTNEPVANLNEINGQ